MMTHIAILLLCPGENLNLPNLPFIFVFFLLAIVIALRYNFVCISMFFKKNLVSDTLQFNLMTELLRSVALF